MNNEHIYILALAVTLIILIAVLIERIFSSKASAELEIERNNLISKVEMLESEKRYLEKENTIKEQQMISLDEKLKGSETEYEKLSATLTKDFENLANKIFDAKQQSAREGITNILEPLQNKLQDFRNKVEQVYDTESKERITLKVEVQKMMETNQLMSKQADSLTDALRGGKKAQGSWGEMVLEKILEESGLRKDYEYKLQAAYKFEDRNRYPDAVIELPDNKQVIIDSKVSLVNYERYIVEPNLETLKELLKDFKNHIKGLSEKNYSQMPEINAPDFTVMFCPIEGAFSLLVAHDPELFSYAWEKKIVFGGPSTLVAILKTVASLWKSEAQNKNAVEIATQAGALYDKFVGFLSSFEDVGTRIRQATDAYDKTFNLVKDGRDSLVRKTDRLRELGARVKKEIPEKFKDTSDE